MSEFKILQKQYSKFLDAHKERRANSRSPISLGGCCTGGNFNLSVPPPPPISEPHLMPRAFTKERARDDAEQQADELLVLSLLLEEDDDLEAELMGIDLADEELDVWDSSLLADNELTELLELVALDWMEIAAYLGDTSRGPYNDIPKSTDFFSVLLSKYVLTFAETLSAIRKRAYKISDKAVTQSGHLSAHSSHFTVMSVALSFDAYSTPSPEERFSAESVGNLTFGEAASMLLQNRLPLILPRDSIISWVFHDRVPTEPEALTLADNEPIPHREDLLAITETWETAYADSARSVYIDLPNLERPMWYHFSKIRLIRNANNHFPHLLAASGIFKRIQASPSPMLPPECIEKLEATRLMEPLAGFHGTHTPLHTLGCLLDEQWASEDVLNAAAEMMYFYRGVMKELCGDPSFLFLPTLFINECRRVWLLDESIRGYSQNMIWVRERIRAGRVHGIGMLVCTSNHYSAIVKIRLDELEHGDSLHLPAQSDLLPILRWVFAGLGAFDPGNSQAHIKPGLIDRQRSLAGEGSCGIAALNFIAFRTGMQTPRWMADESLRFRDELLHALLRYHLIARQKSTTFSDWVVLCALKGEDAEVAFPIEALGVAVGYSDFNLYALAVNMSHPIFDWAIAVQQQHPPHNGDPFAAPTVSSGTNADLQPPIILNSLPQPKKLVPPLHGLTEIVLEAGYDYSSMFPLPEFGPGEAKSTDIVEIPDSPPKTPPRRIKSESELIDLCSPDNPTTAPRYTERHCRSWPVATSSWCEAQQIRFCED
ncbi:hypothetical protein R3P38DRAFT_2759426 [Favolaschia claudopus]|uniref:Ubiquitin-like protease family profile domain-containing protein n=1 Tax=Favolaschia claudopus TaxID=2862362 RepID=A0AAW0DY53_9AGAR